MSDNNGFIIGGGALGDRHIDELVGLAKGIAADGKVTHEEVEFLEKWLCAHLSITDNDAVRKLYQRVHEILSDGIVDEDEKQELFDTLSRLSARDFSTPATFSMTALPLSEPAPALSFPGKQYSFAGMFEFGKRKACEGAVEKRGGLVGPISAKTDFLVIGGYATDKWKQSAFGAKIMKACDYRDQGFPVAIVSENHWLKYL